jgi:hypothetical protein
MRFVHYNNYYCLSDSPLTNIVRCSGGGGSGGSVCTSGKGATVTARYSVASTAWNSVISVVVARVGYVSGALSPSDGYGTGFGGKHPNPNLSSGGGGGSSVSIAVRNLEMATTAPALEQKILQSNSRG